METLEIHSKDFLVKWVHAPDNCSIVWELKPLKKSINFGIYKKSDFSTSTDLLAGELLDRNNAPERPMAPFSDSSDTMDSIAMNRMRSQSVASVNQITELSTYKTKSRSSTFSSNLNSSNLVPIKKYNKLIPGELLKGTFEITKGGMFAFIFDNSFSKTTSKKVLFSSTIVPNADSSSMSKASSFINNGTPLPSPSFGPRSKDLSNNIMTTKNGEVLQSVLLKKRRKKLQGFTKRLFVLNFKYGTLSYFKNNDKNLRGQMPIKSSIVSANSKTREFFIDSGMEVWDLKALNKDDFDAWVDAFNIVKKNESTPQESAAKGHNDDYKSILVDTERRLASLLSGDYDKSELEKHILAICSQVQEFLERNSGLDLSPSVSTAEFFDARDEIDESVVIMDSFPTEKKWDDELEEHESSDSDSNSEDELPVPSASLHDAASEHNPSTTDDADLSLCPLPLEPVKRIADVPVFEHDPPSLLSFVRKNVGKDMSSLSMPVDMNEPVSILQKYAEILEYCDMIDNALQGNYLEASGEKILRIAAFAVTYLSSMRKKVRSLRKPFNPLLGETFELVREDKGFRLVSEKVSHRPAVFAMNAESQTWTLSFSPAPTQKFWGKTSEFYTSGTVRLSIKSTGEVFTWNHPTCVLKNIIAGEKYTEPSSSISVKSSSGQRAVVEFAKGGMFTGRSEDLTIKAYDSQKRSLPSTVVGTWTESMTLKSGTIEKTIWTAGAMLPNWEKKFGFTEFVGTLNKITKIEDGFLPPSDSRLRPDMQAYEKCDILSAEKLKHQLEEGQRARRKKLEQLGGSHVPLYFVHEGGDPSKPETGEWVYKKGPESYWNRRKAQKWPETAKLW